MALGATAGGASHRGGLLLLDRLQEPHGDLRSEYPMAVQHLADPAGVHADTGRRDESRNATLRELASEECGVYALFIKLSH
jgi:hypothetical protein